jgi:two-component system sensor histidine kinase BarA
MPREKEKVMQAGMNGILIKPVSDSTLQKLINQWVLKEPIKTADSNDSDYSRANDDDDTDSVFSIKLAKEFTGNNEELAYELFDMLRAELSSYKEAISLAVENNDITKLRDTVHKLHGASRCCGTTELKQSSSHIETMITQNINFDMEKEITVLLTAIKNVADYKINKET